jgi:hypothetical protein
VAPSDFARERVGEIAARISFTVFESTQTVIGKGGSNYDLLEEQPIAERPEVCNFGLSQPILLKLVQYRHFLPLLRKRLLW